MLDCHFCPRKQLNQMSRVQIKQRKLPLSREQAMILEVVHLDLHQNENLKFVRTWLKDFPWLTCDVEANQMFCKLCRQHNLRWHILYQFVLAVRTLKVNRICEKQWVFNWPYSCYVVATLLLLFFCRVKCEHKTRCIFLCCIFYYRLITTAVLHYFSGLLK